MNTSEIGLHAPDSGRRPTLVAALEELHRQKPVGAHIVEIGTTRNLSPAAEFADGWATRVFAWYAHRTCGSLTTIDIHPLAIEQARTVCAPYADAVRFVCADALVAVRDLTAPVDLLYMDGPPDPAWHLALYDTLAVKPPLVLFDDIVPLDERPGRWPTWPPPGADGTPWAVKGALAIPAMLRDGYRVAFARQRQALLVQP